MVNINILDGDPGTVHSGTSGTAMNYRNHSQYKEKRNRDLAQVLRLHHYKAPTILCNKELGIINDQGKRLFFLSLVSGDVSTLPQ